MHALEELGQLRQWVAWMSVPAAPKPRKVPVDVRTGRGASSTDPRTWATFDHAADYYQRRAELAGLGFVFSAADAYAGIDLDGCRDPETGALLPWAATLVSALDSYTELSPSGMGLHVIVRATVPSGGNRTGPVEMYDRGRYFTMTGREWPGSPTTINDRQAALSEIHATLFAPDPATLRAPPPPLADVPADDRVLVERMFASRNGPEIRQLWYGDLSKYAGDDSDADAALAGRLAYWTGRDAARMDRLFRQSGLYRPKWDEQRGKRTYGERTIAYVLAGR